MISFTGEFECRADAKGRIVLPSDFKKEVGEEELCFVARKHLFDNCLEIYLNSHWEEMLKKLRLKLNPYNRKHEQLRRSLFQGTKKFVLDGNGRFLVPKSLMDKVNADRDVILLGIDNKIELWAIDAYNSKEEDPNMLGPLAEEILGNDDNF